MGKRKLRTPNGADQSLPISASLQTTDPRRSLSNVKSNELGVVVPNELTPVGRSFFNAVINALPREKYLRMDLCRKLAFAAADWWQIYNESRNNRIDGVKPYNQVMMQACAMKQLMSIFDLLCITPKDLIKNEDRILFKDMPPEFQCSPDSEP